MTLDLFDCLLDSNSLRDELKEDAGLDHRDMVFIKELMIGLPISKETGLPIEKQDINNDVWPYQGRGEEKAFLYEIVANKNTGIIN
jgi:hypothetical protein